MVCGTSARNGQGEGGRSLFTRAFLEAHARLYSPRALQTLLAASCACCELIFGCDHACSASAELRSGEWIALYLKGMPSQVNGSGWILFSRILQHINPLIFRSRLAKDSLAIATSVLGQHDQRVNLNKQHQNFRTRIFPLKQGRPSAVFAVGKSI